MPCRLALALALALLAAPAAEECSCCPSCARPCCASRALEAAGSVRALRAPGCQLQPDFDPAVRFYVVDCPEQAATVHLEAESIFPLLGGEGEVLSGPMAVSLGPGDTKVITIKACADVSGTGCSEYRLDVHRRGSSEALLAELRITDPGGGSDVPLVPTFHPSVRLYRAAVPFQSASAKVVAAAAKGGFVSYTSFSAADHHSQSLDVHAPAGLAGTSRFKSTKVQIFVVSADWTGKMQYSIEFSRAANTDTSLAAVASNVGAPYTVEPDSYVLEVPVGTREVAISATASDKAARLALAGNRGRGYASAVLQVDPRAPYLTIPIAVEAADRVTRRNSTLVVAMTGHESWAMLTDLVVPHCEGGLIPSFQINVFHYRCLLGNDVEDLQVIPQVMWMPGFNQQMHVHVQGKPWKSGHVFMQQLSDNGDAEVDVVVQASDREHKATYHISAQGSALSERGRLFTTLEPSPRQPPTTRWVEPTKLPAPVPEPAPVPVPVPEPVPVPTPRPSAPSAARTRRPFLPKFHLQLPEGSLPSLEECASWAGVSAAALSMAALLWQHDLLSFMVLLKELQFVALTADLGDSWYALIAQPFKMFNLQVSWPGLVCQGDCEWPQSQMQAATLITLACFVLPPLLLLLLLGWLEASVEEASVRRGLASGLGVRGLRLKVLPLVLVTLDVGLLGFTDAAARVLASGQKVYVNHWDLNPMLKCLLVVYSFGFCGFGVAQLARLEKLLVWSEPLGCFVDVKCLGVTLRESSYPRPAASAWAAVAEACDGLTELRLAVPICGPDGQTIHLGEPRSNSRSCFVAVCGSSPFGRRRKLLAEGHAAQTAWQLQREHLGLLMWMERRSNAYDSLKVQINEATGHGAITDSQGWPIYDCQGLPLRDLYQYCVYLFPWRPWLRADGSPCCPQGVEPYRKGLGVLAPWVPAQGGMQDLERQQINDWLSDWLVEAEAASAAREELRQLRWYSQELQPAVLREMALAVLERRSFRAPSGTPREAQRAQARLDELPPGPWQVDGLGSHEILAFVNEDLLDSDDMPFYDEELVPDFMDATFGVIRFHVRSPGENPNPDAEPEAPTKRTLRAPGDSLSPRRPPPARVTHHVRLHEVRNTLVTLHLPLKHLETMARWLPAFGFAVACERLALPVAERWAPLFFSSATCAVCRHRPSAQAAAAAAPPGFLYLDAVERVLALVTVWALHGMGQDFGFAVLILPLGTAMLRGICGLGLDRGFSLALGLALALRSFRLCCGLLLVTGALRGLAVMRLLRPGLFGLFGLRGWGLLWRSEWKKECSLAVLNTRTESHEPYPDFGVFQAVDRSASGDALPMLLVVHMLGLQIRAVQSPEHGGWGFEGPSTNERRVAGIRKRLVLFEPCPPGLTEHATDSHRSSVRSAERYRREVQDAIPSVVSRTQLVGAEELPQLVATIHVVNHLGRPWSCQRNDSFLSLYMPWGLDSRQPALTSLPGEQDRDWKKWRNLTTESPELVEAWRSRILRWLDEELAAGMVEHGILDLMFFAGNPGRGPFKEELDKLVAPGIFSDECLGQARFCNSRCHREGRVLHYVISSRDLKPSRAWRPDPLGSHQASLFTASDSQESLASGNSQMSQANLWKPCLLRLNSRQVTYVLREDDDCKEMRVPFVCMDRMEVSRGLHEDECLLTLHGLYGTPQSSATASPRDAPHAPHVSHHQDLDPSRDLRDLRPLAMTPPPASSPRSPRSKARKAMPLVFRISRRDGEVWAKVIEEHGMFTPPFHILHYIGDVADHPLLPGVVFRHTNFTNNPTDGDQLWPDGTRYIGTWQNHTYHGHGQLIDPDGQIIYRGQWSRGMKHGEGTYRFVQEPSGSRAYTGHFHREEFSGRGILWVEEDGSLEWVQKNRPGAIVRFDGNFCGGTGQIEPQDLITIDQRTTCEEHFPLQTGGPQGPGKAPKDHASEVEIYGLDGADLQHCGPDEDAEIWYADGTRYRGPCLAGAVPHGNGVLWEVEAGLCFEGGFDHGLRLPTGRVSLRNGVVYEGEFSQKGGRRHGYGRTDIPDSLQQRLGFQVHEGHYRDGLRHGHGEMLFADGTLYRGNFENNRRHGHGHYRNTNGTPIFTGPWHNDEPGTGNADVLYPSGHRYKGQVCDGCRDGKGSLWHENFDGDSAFIYSGQWEADEMHGKGELHCSDGIYRGQFVNGVREGKGRFEYASDGFSCYEGHWEEDQPHGVGNFVDQHGEYTDKEFFEGEMMGRFASRSRSLFKVKPSTKPSTKVSPGPHKDLPHAGMVCQNAGLLPQEEPSFTRAIDVGSGLANARTHPAHRPSVGLRWA
ncbi:unnamed protein product [Effrenium voratum]|uniref:Uncharacterized protein n=1 Tax=Effrenium voratum TaxID=2562239 RepID=A0AA36JR25_9DINO|nr:unnamed protein product [Effrenium voratum]